GQRAPQDDTLSLHDALPIFRKRIPARRGLNMMGGTRHDTGEVDGMDLRETLREQLGKTGRMLLGVTGDVTEEEGAARPQGLAPIVWQVGHVTYYDALLVQEVLGGPLEV